MTAKTPKTVRLVDEQGRLLAVMSWEVYEADRQLGEAVRDYLRDHMSWLRDPMAVDAGMAVSNSEGETQDEHH